MTRPSLVTAKNRFSLVGSVAAARVTAIGPTCQAQVKQFPNPQFKKFPTEAEAWDFVGGGTQKEPAETCTFDSPSIKKEPGTDAAFNFDSGGSRTAPDSDTATIAAQPANQVNAFDQSTALRTIEMLRATARSLRVTAEQLMLGIDNLSAQIDQVSNSLCVADASEAAAPSRLKKRSYSDFTPLGRGGQGPEDKKLKKSMSHLSGNMKNRFTGTNEVILNLKRTKAPGVPFCDGDGTSVYTDGASFDNGCSFARAGIGVFWGPGDPYNTSKRLSGRQTNNRAEIHAAEVAVRQAKERGIQNLIVNTDSQFLINGITSWINQWKRNGWKLSTGGHVINREDFEKLDEAVKGINVKWVHVKGHSGIVGNEAADKLANDGANKPLQ